MSSHFSPQPKSLPLRICLASLVMVALQTSARADQFLFNTTGTSGGPTVLLNSFSEGAGNVLAVNAQTAIDKAVTSSSHVSSDFTAYYQANITLANTTNQPVSTAPAQFTVVARFNEYATVTGANTVNFNLSANQAGSYYEIFYNPTAVSSPLNGTGFATDSSTAKLIYSGSLTGSNTGTFINNGLNTGPTANNNLDQVTNPTANPSKQQSVSGNGGETFYINTTYQDPNFFLSKVAQQTFTTTNDVAFHQTAASKMFIDLNPSTPNASGYAPTASGGSSYFAPVLPTVNGIGTNDSTRQDFQFEAIASSSFLLVPEPASIVMTLVGLGMIGLAGLRARRKVATA